MAEKEVASSMDAPSSENEGIYLTAQCTTEEAVSTAGHLDEEKRTPNVLSSCNDNISSLEIATSPVNAVQGISSGIQNFDSIAAYQRRQPIEVWKYKELKSEDGKVVFKCTRCSSVYKHKKTLNKHWKDKHSDADSKETDESVGGSLTNAESLDASPCSGTSSHRRGMRNSLRRAPCDDLPTMVKRRRTAIPIAPVASTSNWTPLDLAVTQGTNSEAALAEEARENAEVKGTEEGNGKEPRQTQETTPPSSQRVLLTGLLQTTLDVLNAEPASVMNIDDISPSASAMLHVLGSILCFSTNRVAKPVVASSWIGRTQGLQIPYPLSNGGGRPMNGLNGHMVNHRNLRDQMEHLPDDAVVHFATYHPPPLIDSLNQAVSTSATALSQVNPSLLALSIPVVAQAPQPPVGGLSDSHEMEAKSSESDNTADGIADTASNSQTSALTDAPPVVAPVSQSVNGLGQEDETKEAAKSEASPN